MATTKHWTEAPDAHEYPAAEDYLSLLTAPATSNDCSGLICLPCPSRSV
jgi:hypothetical protein